MITFLPLTFQLEEVRLLFGFYEEESHSDVVVFFTLAWNSGDPAFWFGSDYLVIQ